MTSRTSLYVFSYRLWQKVWSVWTEFVQLSRSKRKKRELTCNFASRRSLCRAWKGWNQHVLARREKKVAEIQVKQWNVMRVKRCVSLSTCALVYIVLPSRTVWCKWKTALEKKRQLVSMNSLALHHWALQLQRRVSLISANYDVT